MRRKRPLVPFAGIIVVILAVAGCADEPATGGGIGIKVVSNYGGEGVWVTFEADGWTEGGKVRQHFVNDGIVLNCEDPSLDNPNWWLRVTVEWPSGSVLDDETWYGLDCPGGYLLEIDESGQMTLSPD